MTVVIIVAPGYIVWKDPAVLKYCVDRMKCGKLYNTS
jgi:hypothetical protein